MRFLESLTMLQKVFLPFFIGIIIFATYALSSLVSIFLLMPNIGEITFSKITQIFQIVNNYYSLSLPIDLINDGQAILYFKGFGISVILILLFLTLLFISNKLNSKKRNIHGKAKWSSLADLKKAKLLDKEGIIVGKYRNRLLKFGGSEFVSLGAPTRSGKGISVVIPNLLEWNNSLVVFDVKGELFDITSNYRKKILRQNVYVFDPFSTRTHCYNPLDYLDFEKEDIELRIQAIANTLYPAGKGNKDFFVLQAQNLFVAIVYLMGKLRQEELLASSFTLTTLAGAISSLEIDLGNEEAEKINLKEAYLTAEDMGLLTNTIASKFSSFYMQEEAKDQYAGVISSFENALKIFQTPLFENATKKNDFDFRDLRKKKITIYISIGIDNLITARPILNLFFQQLMLENIKQGLLNSSSDLKHNMLLLMDEFTSIGYMEQYQSSIAYMAGYGIRSLIIYQNQTQLTESPPLGYGDKGADTLLENHACNIIFRPTKTTFAEQVSKRVGNQTIETSSLGTNTKDPLHASRNKSLQSRALVLPQEVMNLKDDEQLLFCNRVTVICKKSFYFNDPYFIKKLKAVAPSLANNKRNISESDLLNAINDLRIDLPKTNIEDMEY